MTSRMLLRTSLLATILILGLVASPAGAVTIGSLAPPVTEDGGCGSCNQFQVTSDAASPSYEVPFDGIITGFSMRTGSVTSTDKVALMLTYQKTSVSFTLKYMNDPLQIPAASANGVATFPVRVPVTAGWSLGVWGDTSTTPLSYVPSPTVSDTINSYGLIPVVGQTGTGSSSSPGHRINMTANVEHDADGDGYGDETQDCFPADPSRHGDCPDTTAPTVTLLKARSTKFKVTKKSRGTKIGLTSTEAATATFTVFRAKGKKQKKVFSFISPIVSGANTVKFTGRYKSNKKTKLLVPSKYVIKMTAVDAAGNKSAAVSAKFTVKR